MPDGGDVTQLARGDFAAVRQFPDDAHDLSASERHLHQLPRARGLIEPIVEQREQRRIERHAGDSRRTEARLGDRGQGIRSRCKRRGGQVVGAGQT
ncbi:hypothetical protein DRB87_22180 [Pandoraea sp. XY-2]|nr:hypothetical protein DRB87_22180 [Pandoraea sp. XY-2]